MSLKGIIFDLDGTLLDTIDDLADSCNRQLEEYGYPTHPAESYRYFVGNGVRKLVERALPDTEEARKITDRFVQDFRSDYQDHCFDRTRPYPGIPELLKRLKQDGLVLAVLSNKPDTETKKVVRHFFPKDQFHCAAGHKEEFDVKPDPAGVHAILNKLNLRAEETAFVGDTWIDMQTAVNSGCFPVGILWGFRDRPELEDAGARAIAADTGELYSILNTAD
ncbi:HAD family hydrolase [Marispirochaeta sp.]|uniref:HAD family hydrolase n=1 Tax=Marispirochaeta sp. TaxID=2038653 RepID=UPI0029C95E53|nr:HAD family hydrolase [Marispirochaeta sp.]